MKKIIFIVLVVMCAAHSAHAQTTKTELKVNGGDDIVTVQKGDKINVSWSGIPANQSCSVLLIFNSQNILVDQGGGLTSNGSYVFTADIPKNTYIAQNNMDWEKGEWLIVYLLCNGVTKNTPTDIVSVVVFDEIHKIEITAPKSNGTLVAGKKIDVKWKSDKKEVKKVQLTLTPAETYIMKGDEILNLDEYNKRFRYMTYGVKNKNKFSWKIPKDTLPGFYTISVGEMDGHGDAEVLVNIVSSKNK